MQDNMRDLRMDITSNCNIRCIMCQAYNEIPVTKYQVMDFDAFVVATKGVLHKFKKVQLGHTAEAMIHPRFADFVKYIRSESDAIIYIVTNGKLLDRHADLINKTGNCLVQISIDSIKRDVHEYIRHGSNYDKLMKNLSLIDTDKCEVLLSFTMMRSNIGEYKEMTEFCGERSYSMAVFPMIMREERSIIPYNLILENLWFSMNELRIWLKDYYGNDYDRVVIGTAAGAEASLGMNEFNCQAHHEDVGIGWNGSATLCFKVGVGSIGNRSLEEVLASDEARKFQALVDKDRGPCFDCDYLKRCMAPSMSQMYNYFSDPILNALSDEAKNALSFERTISDEEARALFVREASQSFGIFDIEKRDGKFHARRVVIDELGAGEYVSMSEPPLESKYRHELHTLMRDETAAPNDVRMVETYGSYNIVTYLRRYWALPLSLGVLHLTEAADRAKPGIMDDPDLANLKKICDREMNVSEEPEPTPVVAATASHRIVHHLGEYWGVPISLDSESRRAMAKLTNVEDLQDVLTRLGFRKNGDLEVLIDELGGAP